MILLEGWIGILSTAGVVFLLILLEVLSRRSRKVNPVSYLESQLKRKGFSVEKREAGSCTFLLARKPFKRILAVVGKRLDVETLKEVFYVSYTEGVNEIDLFCSEITKEALEAVRMVEKNRKIHKTKVRYERDVVGFRI